MTSTRPIFRKLGISIKDPRFRDIHRRLLRRASGKDVLPFRPINFFQGTRVPMGFVRPTFRHTTNNSTRGRIPPRRLKRTIRNFRVRKIIGNGISKGAIIKGKSNPRTPNGFQHGRFTRLLKSIRKTRIRSKRRKI